MIKIYETKDLRLKRGTIYLKSKSIFVIKHKKIGKVFLLYQFFDNLLIFN